MTALPQFTKIAYSPKDRRVRLEYTLEVGDADEPAVEEHTVGSPYPPHEDLVDALASLRRHVIQMCELAGAVDEDDLEVRGVSLRWKDGSFGVTITALRALSRSSSPLVLNTPFTLAEAEGGPTLDDDAVLAVRALIEEAVAFLGGKRGEREPSAQEELFEEATEESGITSITISRGGGPSVTMTPRQLNRAATSFGRRGRAGRR